MSLFVQRFGWSCGFNVGQWWFTVYLNLRHWAFDWHVHASCCKYWLLIGPFEVNRMWTDDEYPDAFGVEDCEP